MKNTHKAALTILALAVIASAQIKQRWVPPFPANSYPNPAVAKICGNSVVPNGDIPGQIELVRSQGCSEVRLIPTDADNTLVFGVKILMGE